MVRRHRAKQIEISLSGARDNGGDFNFMLDYLMVAAPMGMTSSRPPSNALATEASSEAMCLNCKALLSNDAVYCKRCGQETTQHAPTLREFIHEFITHYVALEGALWRTLKALAFSPGFLTVEYLAGVRRYYVLPLRLLLSLSFVFFLLIKMDFGGGAAPADSHRTSSVQADSASLSSSIGMAQSVRRPAEFSIMIGNRELVVSESSLTPRIEFLIEALPNRTQEAMRAAYVRWNEDPASQTRRAISKCREMMPMAVLISLPLFSGLLAIVLFSRRLNFGVHFVFAMHLHAFYYLIWPAFAVATLFSIFYMDWMVLGWWLIYPVLAIKRVYKLDWIRTLISSAAIFILHVVIISAGLLTMFITALLSN